MQIVQAVRGFIIHDRCVAGQRLLVSVLGNA